MSSITYRPEIDGLRAVAVIPVVLFHMGMTSVSGGFIGVDVFFVISGYLITAIILKEYDQGIFSFTNFWLRRVRRILPVLILMVVTTSIAANYIVYKPEINDVGKQGLSSLLSSANIYLLFSTGNYWGPKAENSLFLHTWSLSVEEQFYLFFPLLIILLLKVYRKRLVVSVLFLILVSISLFLYGSIKHPTATFYLLPTRAWELGVGCLLAISTQKGKFKILDNSIWAIIGLLAILFSYVFIGEHLGVSAFLVIPVLGTVLVLGCSHKKDNPVNRLLSSPSVLYIGKISYSLYIWHWPIIALSKDLSMKWNYELSPLYTLSLIVFISVFSYHLIEKTTRKNKNIVPFVFLGLFAAIILTSLLSVSNFSEDVSAYSETTWYGQPYNVNPKLDWPKNIVKRMTGITVQNPDSSDRTYYSKGGIKKLYGKGNPEIVVLGDSHVLMWSRVLDIVAKELGKSVAFFGADGTSTFFKIPVTETGGTLFL